MTQTPLPKKSGNRSGVRNNEWLGILDRTIGDESRAFLKRNGLTSGMTVADVGCGTGIMTCWLAKQVGPTGHVYAVDVSEKQIKTAREAAAQENLTNITFITAEAHNTSLAPASLDIVYGRCILFHVNELTETIAHLFTVLRPNGKLLSDELVRDKVQLEPAHPALDTFTQYRIQKHIDAGRDPFAPLTFPEKFSTAGFAVTHHEQICNTMLLSDIQRMCQIHMELADDSRDEQDHLSRKTQAECVSAIEKLTTKTHPHGYWTQVYTVAIKK